MKNLKIALSVAAVFVVATVVLGYLYVAQKQQFEEQRARVASLEEELHNRLSEIEGLQTKTQKLRRQKNAADRKSKNLEFEIAGLKNEKAELAAKLQPSDTQTIPEETELAALDEEMLGPEESADAEAKKVHVAAEKTKETFRRMLKNPEMRKMFRKTKKMALEKMYGDLFKELWLEPDDLEAFKELIVDKGMLEMEIVFGMNVDSNDTGTQEAKEEINGEFRELLGNEKYDIYDDYYSTTNERMLVVEYKKGLEQNQIIALAEYQEDHLIRIMNEEKSNFGFTLGSEMFGSFNRLATQGLDAHYEEMEEMKELVLKRSQE